MPGDCTPPVPDPIPGCTLSHVDEIIIPYAAYAIQYQNGDFNCQVFNQLVKELEDQYFDACNQSSS